MFFNQSIILMVDIDLGESENILTVELFNGVCVYVAFLFPAIYFCCFAKRY